jgi:hypothetical protein
MIDRRAFAARKRDDHTAHPAGQAVRPASDATRLIAVLFRRLWFATILLVAALPMTAAMTMSIDGNTVTARGLTPGGGAVFFSAAHRPRGYAFAIEHVAEFVTDDDRDGVVTYTASKDIPWKSIWFAVDARTGAYETAAPEGLSDRRNDARRSRVERDTAGEWSRFEHERGWLLLLVIRPGGEVWMQPAMRGGTTDVGRRGAVFITPADSFEALTPNARPLRQLTAADVVIGIDMQTVEYFVTRIGQ